MGESDRYIEYKHSKKKLTLGQDGNALMGLFSINVILFLLLLTMHTIHNYYEKGGTAFESQVIPNIAFPSGFSAFAYHPWTLITYMFSHFGVWDMLSNMLWLWAFGYLLQDLIGRKQLFPVYIYGGLSGAIFFIVAGALFSHGPVIGYLSGAGASTLAIATAVCVYAPDYRFFRQINRGIPIWVLLVLYFVLDFIRLADNEGIVLPLLFAHIGGAVAGFLYIVLLRKDIDAGRWMNALYQWCLQIFSPSKKKGIREKVFYNTGNREPFVKSSNLTQQRVDEILDKINQKGYQFLSEEEKKILRRASEEDL